MLPIQKRLVNYNFNKGGNQIRYIVIHDTGNPGASAMNHYKYFGGGNRGASAHYFVDEENIIQIIEGSDRAWHCGDGKGRYGISNSNSIGIEMCLIGNDIEKEMSNVIDLTAYLMKKYNISIDRVVRHYDASRKMCPNVMSKNNWAKWWRFKELLNERLNNVQSKPKGDDIVKFEHKWQEELLIKSIETLSKGGLINNSEDWIGKFKSGKLTTSELSLLSLAVSSRIAESK